MAQTNSGATRRLNIAQPSSYLHVSEKVPGLKSIIKGAVKAASQGTGRLELFATDDGNAFGLVSCLGKECICAGLAAWSEEGWAHFTQFMEALDDYVIESGASIMLFELGKACEATVQRVQTLQPMGLIALSPEATGRLDEGLPSTCFFESGSLWLGGAPMPLTREQVLSVSCAATQMAAMEIREGHMMHTLQMRLCAYKEVLVEQQEMYHTVVVSRYAAASAHRDERNTLRLRHQMLTDKMCARHQEALDTTRAEGKEDMDMSHAQHACEIQRLQQDHQKQMGIRCEEHAEDLSMLRSELELAMDIERAQHKEVEAMHEEHAVEMEAHRRWMQAERNKLRETQAKLAAMQREVRQLRERAEGAETALLHASPHTEELTTAMAALSACQTELSAYQMANAACKEDLSRANTEGSSCQTELAAHKKELSDVKLQLSSCEKDLTACREALSSATAGSGGAQEADVPDPAILEQEALDQLGQQPADQAEEVGAPAEVPHAGGNMGSPAPQDEPPALVAAVGSTNDSMLGGTFWPMIISKTPLKKGFFFISICGPSMNGPSVVKCEYRKRRIKKGQYKLNAWVVKIGSEEAGYEAVQNATAVLVWTPVPLGSAWELWLLPEPWRSMRLAKKALQRGKQTECILTAWQAYSDAAASEKEEKATAVLAATPLLWEAPVLMGVKRKGRVQHETGGEVGEPVEAAKRRRMEGEQHGDT